MHQACGVRLGGLLLMVASEAINEFITVPLFASSIFGP